MHQGSCPPQRRRVPSTLLVHQCIFQSGVLINIGEGMHRWFPGRLGPQAQTSFCDAWNRDT